MSSRATEWEHRIADTDPIAYSEGDNGGGNDGGDKSRKGGGSPLRQRIRGHFGAGDVAPVPHDILLKGDSRSIGWLYQARSTPDDLNRDWTSASPFRDNASRLARPCDRRIERRQHERLTPSSLPAADPLAHSDSGTPTVPLNSCLLGCVTTTKHYIDATRAQKMPTELDHPANVHHKSLDTLFDDDDEDDDGDLMLVDDGESPPKETTGTLQPGAQVM